MTEVPNIITPIKQELDPEIIDIGYKHKTERERFISKLVEKEQEFVVKHIVIDVLKPILKQNKKRYLKPKEELQQIGLRMLKYQILILRNMEKKIDSN